MDVETWFRNPDLYIRECVELGASWIAWDRGYLVKKRIDAVRFADLYYPPNTEYRLLAIGDQGTAELRRGRGLDNPVAVYPTWEYAADDLTLLEEMLAHPVGDDATACADTSLPADERPTQGQEHRVVVTRPPNLQTGVGRKFARVLQELQEEYPDAILHLHGVYSYRVMFGMGLRSVDVDPRAPAHKGNVQLPNGKKVAHEDTRKTPQWVNVVGYNPSDLEVPRNRCMFNMRSAQWAAKHFLENVKFKSRGDSPVDPDAKEHVPATTNAVKSKNVPATVGDKFVCDLCSLQDRCKYFRSGGVCSIPESEPAPLARFFKTRDAQSIIEGLGTLMAAQTGRLQRGMEYEQDDGELSSEVTKIINSLFANGVKLAKLVDPRLAAAAAPRTAVQVNVGTGADATPQALTASVYAELVARGVPADQITGQMIYEVIRAGNRPAIEAVSDEVANF